MFGEKVQVAKQKQKDKNGLSEKENIEPKQNRIRGWFPRNCAVELVNDSDDEHEHFTAKKTN